MNSKLKTFLSIGLNLAAFAVLDGCSPVHFEFQESAQITTATGETGPEAATLYGPTHTADTTLRMIDRTSVKSILDQIFGPTVASITNDLIYTKAIQFGGPCDPNQVTTVTNTQGQIVNVYDCSADPNTHSQSQFPLVPSSISARESYRIRACDRIVSNNNAVLFATRQVNSTVALTTNAVPTSEEVRSVYQQFYLGSTPSDEVLQSLMAVVTQTQQLRLNAFEAWRFLYLTLCLAPDWQLS